MSNEPHFFARKYQEFQRASAKGYLCPLCPNTENFQLEPKLWEHAKTVHLQELGILQKGEEGDVRKQFRQDASERAHRTLGKITRDSQTANSKPSSNDNDSMKPNVGEDARSTAPSRPFSAPGLSHDPEKRIGDIGKLTLGQVQPSYAAGTPSPSSPPNPLKRGTRGESDHPESSFDQTPGNRTASNRRTKALSGGPFIGKDREGKDPEFDREASRPNESSTSRNYIGSAKRLFDPNTDDPSSSPTNRRNKQEPSTPVRRLNDPRPHVYRSKKAPSGERQEFQPKINYDVEHLNEQQFKHIGYLSQPPVNIKRSYPTSQDEIYNTSQGVEDEWESDPQILLQPETRPISHEQLVVEVKGIYAGLIMVEAKCIDVDEKQSSQAQEMDPSRQTKLSNEQWQALIALHKTLLHEHHDFFLASQHPSASPALSRLAAKYLMPARMWRHGIHAFLEVLRRRLPESLDHMLAFIYIAYSMMALLYETVSTFEDTWIECLGDLGRYRMAIEDDDIRDREVWSNVARFWYSKAADKSPTVGRLYHHLAILARPYTLQQLSFYTRSLTCVTPFESARVSILTHFNPILNGKEPVNHRSSSFETLFIKAHGMLFSGKSSEEFDAAVRQMMDGVLDHYIGRIAAKFREQGVFAAVANIAALFEYGSVKVPGVPKSIFRLAFDQVKISQSQQEEKPKTAIQQNNDGAFNVSDGANQYPTPTNQLGLESLTSSEFQSSQRMVSHASKLAFGTLSVALRRIGDKNVLPLIHVYFVFLWSLAGVEKAMIYVEKDIPWGGICLFLNHVLTKIDISTSAALITLMAEQFPQFDNGIGRPLPEEFAIRGQTYTQGYFPDAVFKDAKVDDEERSLELPSMATPRMEKILWLGFRIASLNHWIKYIEESKTFEVVQLPTEPPNASLDESERSRDHPLILDQDNHDVLMSDVGTIVPSSDEEINNSVEVSETSMKLENSTSNSNNSNIKRESSDNVKADVPMIDAGSVELQLTNSKSRSDDPVKETTDETWLGNAPGRKTVPPQKPKSDYYPSDVRKLRLMETYDISNNKNPSKA